MFASTLISALAALPLALAVTHDVTVGAAGMLEYNPSFITAMQGDIVQFTFMPKNHTVTQSSFAAPCVPLSGGITSGFMPVAADATSFPTFSLTVTNATTPLWFHCEQTGHCGKGMVFAINAPAPPSPKSFDAFKALATGGQNSTSSAAPATSTSTGMSDDNNTGMSDDSNTGMSDDNSTSPEVFCTQLCSQLYLGGDNMLGMY